MSSLNCVTASDGRCNSDSRFWVCVCPERAQENPAVPCQAIVEEKRDALGALDLAAPTRCRQMTETFDGMTIPSAVLKNDLGRLSHFAFESLMSAHRLNEEQRSICGQIRHTNLKRVTACFFLFIFVCVVL